MVDPGGPGGFKSPANTTENIKGKQIITVKNFMILLSLNNCLQKEWV